MCSKIVYYGIMISVISTIFKVETTGKEVDLPFVVSFIYKHMFPATALCSGAILTEKLILSAAYPITAVEKGQHCVLPGVSKLHLVQEHDIEKDCIDIEKFHRSHYNIVIVKLATSIFFKWTISTVKLIIPKDLTSFRYSHSCLLPGWNYKKAASAPGVYLTHVATELILNGITIEGVDEQYGTLKPSNGSQNFFLCNADFGMPLLCDYFLIGIIANADISGNIECKTYTSFSYTNIMTPEIQNYLKMEIPLSANLKEYLALND